MTIELRTWLCEQVHNHARLRPRWNSMCRPGVKRHRSFYNAPAWMRDGFSSETEYNEIMQKDREEWMATHARQHGKAV